jgi:hypothetical protein
MSQSSLNLIVLSPLFSSFIHSFIHPNLYQSLPPYCSNLTSVHLDFSKDLISVLLLTSNLRATTETILNYIQESLLLVSFHLPGVRIEFKPWRLAHSDSCFSRQLLFVLSLPPLWFREHQVFLCYWPLRCRSWTWNTIVYGNHKTQTNARVHEGFPVLVDELSLQLSIWVWYFPWTLSPSINLSLRRKGAWLTAKWLAWNQQCL